MGQQLRPRVKRARRLRRVKRQKAVAATAKAKTQRAPAKKK